MQPTYTDSQIAVFDDVLPAERFTQLWDHLQRVPYQRVHSRMQQGVWRLQDGDPLQGSTTAYAAIPVEALTGGQDIAGLGIDVFPTGTALDPALAAVVELAPRMRDLIGEPGKDWLVLTASPWLYPAGTRLSWHEDAIGYTGAFVFYAHPRWNVQWGGELLVADARVRAARRASTTPRPPPAVGQRLDNQLENDELSGFGIGQFIVPRPNRLVFIASGTPHMIAQVSAAAGDNVRASIGGFFVDAAGIEGFLSSLQR